MDVQVDDAGVVGVASPGEERAAVRARLGDFQEFRRAPSAPEQDAFADGVMVAYGPDGRVVTVEVARDTTCWFRGVRLSGRDSDAVVADLGALGVPVEVLDEACVQLGGFDIFLYVEDGRVEGVQVGDA